MLHNGEAKRGSEAGSEATFPNLSKPGFEGVSSWWAIANARLGVQKYGEMKAFFLYPKLFCQKPDEFIAAENTGPGSRPSIRLLVVGEKTDRCHSSHRCRFSWRLVGLGRNRFDDRSHHSADKKRGSEATFPNFSKPGFEGVSSWWVIANARLGSQKRGEMKAFFLYPKLFCQKPDEFRKRGSEATFPNFSKPGFEGVSSWWVIANARLGSQKRGEMKAFFLYPKLFCQKPDEFSAAENTGSYSRPLVRLLVVGERPDGCRSSPRCRFSWRLVGLGRNRFDDRSHHPADHLAQLTRNSNRAEPADC